MNISWTGQSPVSIKILRGWAPETTPGWKFIQLSNGNYTTIDQGVFNDKYDCTINFHGTETFINSVINLFESNRNSSVPSQVLLSSINSTEHIFGEDVNYTSGIYANVMSVELRNQGSLRGFGLSMKLSAISPTFIGGNGSLPEFRFLDIGYTGDSEYTNNHFESYDGVYSNPDHQADAGVFEGSYRFFTHEMMQLRAYIRYLRGNSFSLPYIYGVNYPFGRLSTSYPYNVRIVEFEDMGLVSVNDYKARIKFALVL
jgi:hypothetical protein